MGALAGEVASKWRSKPSVKDLLTRKIRTLLSPAENANHSLISKLYGDSLRQSSDLYHRRRTDPQFQGMGATLPASASRPERSG